MLKSVFQEGVSSVFIVNTPLQVICAVEAINRFKIKKYKILLPLPENEVRNDQTINVCKKFNLFYSVVPSNIKGLKWFGVFNKSRELYDRAFIGDLRSLYMYVIAAKNIKNHAPIISLDDGNDTIFLLKGEVLRYPTFKARLVKQLVLLQIKLRGITVGHDLFTIYGDIDNHNYRCENNTLKTVSILASSSKRYSGICFVGTNYSRFCSPENYPLEIVKSGLDRILGELRNNNPVEKIVYIPHGRDVAEFPNEICNKYNIEIIRPLTNIEVMLLEADVIPHSIYGFTSTALYNIKVLLPKIDVYNVTFEVGHNNQFIDQVKVVSDYYSSHGIVEIKL